MLIPCGPGAPLITVRSTSVDPDCYAPPRMKELGFDGNDDCIVEVGQLGPHAAASLDSTGTRSRIKREMIESIRRRGINDSSCAVVSPYEPDPSDVRASPM